MIHSTTALGHVYFPNHPAELSFGTTLGADPEGFLLDNKGHVICPTKLGLKPELGDIVYLQNLGESRLTADGAQLELHPSAGGCRGYLTDSLRRCLYGAKTLAESKNLRFTIEPVVKVSTGNLRKFTPDALVCGCEPDWDAYTLTNTLESAPDFSKHPLRYGGGHIHMSVTQLTPGLEGTKLSKEDKKHYPAFIMLLDLTVGLFDVIASPSPRLAAMRRRLFGRAGSFREQPWGLEYRTPDNTWLRHPKLWYLHTSLIRQMSQMFRRNLENGGALKQWILEHALTARDIINEVDQSAARELWKKLSPEFEEVCVKGHKTRTETVQSVEWLFTKYLGLFDKYIGPELRVVKRESEPNWKAWALDMKTPEFGTGNVTHARFCGMGLDQYYAEVVPT